MIRYSTRQMMTLMVIFWSVFVTAEREVWPSGWVIESENWPETVRRLWQLQYFNESPTFSFDIRKFPSFLKHFTKLVVSCHGKDPFILRQSLQGKAREATGWQGEFDHMWNRPEERFGSSARIVDAVMSEICGLKPVAEEARQNYLISLMWLNKSGWI